MRPVLIDTDILSYYLKGNKIVFEHFQDYLSHYDTINISVITYYEILSGLIFKDAIGQLRSFENFCTVVTIINLTKDSIKKSADIYSVQRKKGQAIDDIDILIAGTAMSTG